MAASLSILQSIEVQAKELGARVVSVVSLCGIFPVLRAIAESGLILRPTRRQCPDVLVRELR